MDHLSLLDWQPVHGRMDRLIDLCDGCKGICKVTASSLDSAFIIIAKYSN